MTDTLNKDRKDKGFTLLEIMISLGLIAVSLLAVSQLQTRNLDQQIEARFITLAGCLAKNRLAIIESGEALVMGESSGEFGEPYPFFSYEEEIQEIADFQGLYRVRIRIFQKEGGDKPRDFVLESFVYRRRI
ncbi:prepilin-type N-terminal cleavage/methylation domain-containing protein [Thermodesulfobacteriota bacterium]